MRRAVPRALRSLGTGLLVWMLAAAAPPPESVVAPVVVAGGFAVVAGAGALVLLGRVRVVLARRPWLAVRCRYELLEGRGNGQPSLLFEPPLPGCPGPFTVMGFVWRWGFVEDLDGRAALACPLGGRWAVVTSPDAVDVRFLRRPRLKLFHRRRRG